MLLVSSSGMGKNTARAIQFAKMVNKMMTSKVLEGEAQDHNNNTTTMHKDYCSKIHRLGSSIYVKPDMMTMCDSGRVAKNFRRKSKKVSGFI